MISRPTAKPTGCVISSSAPSCPLMDFPPIATRYDKRARYFLAGVCIIVALAYELDEPTQPSFPHRP